MPYFISHDKCPCSYQSGQLVTHRITSKRKHKRKDDLITDTSHNGHMDDQAVHLHKPADAQIRRQQRDLEAQQGERVDRPTGVLHLAEWDGVFDGEVLGV